MLIVFFIICRYLLFSFKVPDVFIVPHVQQYLFKLKLFSPIIILFMSYFPRKTAITFIVRQRVRPVAILFFKQLLKIIMKI